LACAEMWWAHILCPPPLFPYFGRAFSNSWLESEVIWTLTKVTVLPLHIDFFIGSHLVHSEGENLGTDLSLMMSCSLLGQTVISFTCSKVAGMRLPPALFRFFPFFVLRPSQGPIPLPRRDCPYIRLPCPSPPGQEGV